MPHLRGADSMVDVKPLAGLGLAAGDLCPDKSYVGIGIVINPGIDVISVVGTNTPASRAGLQVGDMLWGVDWSKVEGAPIGTVVPFEVMRSGLKFPVTLTVARICRD